MPRHFWSHLFEHHEDQKLEERSFLARSRRATWSLLVLKVFGVLLGWVLMKTFEATVLHFLYNQPVGLEKESLTPAKESTTGGSAEQCFAWMLVLSAALQLFIIRYFPQWSGSSKDAFIASLVYMPAWSLKNIVSTYIFEASKSSFALNIETYYIPISIYYSIGLAITGVLFVNIAFLLAILVLAAGIQLCCANMEKYNVSKGSYVFYLIHALSMCFALSVGFVFNHIVHLMFPILSKVWLLEVHYAAVITGIAYHFQNINAHGEDVVSHLISNVLTSVNFLAAWAWQSVIDSTLDRFMNVQGLQGEFSFACVLTVLVLLVVMISQLDMFAKGPMYDILTFVCGMNSAWAWMDFCSDFAQSICGIECTLVPLWKIYLELLILLLGVAWLGDYCSRCLHLSTPAKGDV